LGPQKGGTPLKRGERESLFTKKSGMKEKGRIRRAIGNKERGGGVGSKKKRGRTEFVAENIHTKGKKEVSIRVPFLESFRTVRRRESKRRRPSPLYLGRNEKSCPAQGPSFEEKGNGVSQRRRDAQAREKEFLLGAPGLRREENR